ncbi:electron transfer flavoprotein subunit alpha/FixB family protein [Georgfuchsia toluolica]|uniref:electron transfer flavoprotein subunit alpha/FixB family protein n=1 Tax=Georgfuchsia toluolica TaxID=424218 RepID=UPI001C72E1BB|nr:electron transfer flavoprotein subunit alpha/FixB family protein [Georgfuchsia toluolica]
MIEHSLESSPNLWVYLDDRDGPTLDISSRMVAESRRFAAAAGLRCCGVARNEMCAQRLVSSGRCSGIDTIYALSDGPVCSEPDVAQVAALLCSAIRLHQPQMLLLSSTALDAEIGARVAAELGCAFLGRCIEIEWREKRPVARRSVYNNRAHQVLCPVGEPPWVVTIDSQILDKTPASETNASTVEINTLSISGKLHATPPVVWRVSARDLDLADADIVLSVGRGVKNEETLEQIHELAELLGAAVGGSREAVFGGLVPRDRQVGASGKWIAPRIYVALGISGSTYHMMGIREAKHLVAVNIDSRAPILGSAEIAIVDDVAKIVPALLENLKGKADRAAAN